MKSQRRIARPARSGQGIFFRACALAAALLSSASGGAQEKPPATPTSARASSAQAEARNVAAQDPPAAPIQKRKLGSGKPAQRVVRPGDEGVAVFRDDNPGQRERWFYEQRAYPLGYIPFGIRQRAVEARDAMRARERQLRIGSFSPQWRTAAAAEPEEPRSHAIPPNTMTWTPIGPQPVTSSSPTVKQVSGRVSAIAVDPTDPDIVYVGGAQGGVWKTVDGGANWTPLSDDQPSLAIGAIAIENSMASCGLSGPCQTIYVGTGEQTFSIGSYYGAGILKSTDGGASWQHIPGPFATVASIATGGARISSLAIRPGTSGATAELLAGVQILFSADSGASSGIYRSVDGGQTWTQVPSASGAVGTDVLFHPSDPNIAYAALGTPFLIGQPAQVDPQNGIYKSVDGGATWTPRNTGLPANRGRIRLAIAPSNPNVLFAAITDPIGNSDHLAGVFRSGDGAVNWTRVAASNPLLGGTSGTVCSSQCWYDLVIRFHPGTENVAYIGGAAQGGYFLRTIDSGANWTAVSFDGSDRLHVDIHAIAFGISGGSVRMWNGNDGGVWSADVSNPTAAIDWQNHNGPAGGSTTALSLSQYYPGHSIHPSNTDGTIAGTQDNGTHVFSGTLNWSEVTCGDGGFTAIDPDVPTVAYATCQVIDIRKSTNCQMTPTVACPFISGFISGINTNDRGAFIPPLVMDLNSIAHVTQFFPARPLYFGTFRVYRSTDQAGSWAAISPDLTTGAGTIRAIAISPLDSRIVWAGASDGRIQRTLDSSQTPASWSNVTGTGMLPNRTVTALAIDPHDPTSNTVYATFSGFTHPSGGDSFGHVFVTTNGGAAWTDISANLPNIPVNDIVVDPDVNGTLFIGTDVGVFFSEDGGVSWMTLQSGFPNVAVLGLKIHPPTRLLRASTHGRGMWDILLTNLNPSFNLASISPTSVAAGSPDTQITATGAGFAATSVVQFNGTNLATAFDAMTGNLQATIPAALLTAGQSVAITVFDATQSPSTTNGLPFSVTNPAPTLTSINPTMAAPGGPGFTLTLNGTNFIGTLGGTPASEVRWNGSPRTTNATLVTSQQITVDLPASDIASPGLNQVTVFNPPPGGGTTAAQTFTVGTPPPNDDFANAIVINSNPFTDTQNNAAATTEANDPVPQVTTGCPASFGFPNAAIGRNHSIWYRFTPSANTTVTADTAGSSFDTVLSAWTGPALGALTQVGCDDDGVASAGASRLSNLALTAGTTYHFMVAGFSSLDAGSAVFNFTIPPDFSVGVNPAAVTVTRGQASQAITVTVTPLNGIAFTNPVALSCTGLPSQSTCVFNPASVTPGANPATATLTITTTAPGMAPPAGPQGVRWSPPPVAVLTLLLMVVLLFAVALSARAARRAPAWQQACFLLAIVILAGIFVSCGGGGGGGGPAPPPPNPGTPTGTFNVTVRGISGGVTKTATVALTVQ